MQAPLIFAFVNEVFQKGPSTAGNFFAVAGIGSFIGSLVIIKIGKKLENFNYLILILLFDGIIFSIFSISNIYSISLVLFSFAGIIGTVFSVVTYTLLQKYVPQKMIGRVFSISTFFTGPVGLLAIVIGSYLAKIYSVRSVFIAAGVLEILIASLCLILLLPKRWNHKLKKYSNNVS